MCHVLGSVFSGVLDWKPAIKCGNSLCSPSCPLLHSSLDIEQLAQHQHTQKSSTHWGDRTLDHWIKSPALYCWAKWAILTHISGTKQLPAHMHCTSCNVCPSYQAWRNDNWLQRPGYGHTDMHADKTHHKTINEPLGLVCRGGSCCTKKEISINGEQSHNLSHVWCRIVCERVCLTTLENRQAYWTCLLCEPCGLFNVISESTSICSNHDQSHFHG